MRKFIVSLKDNGKHPGNDHGARITQFLLYHLLIFFLITSESPMTLRNCASKLIWKAEIVPHTHHVLTPLQKRRVTKALENSTTHYVPYTFSIDI